MHNQKWMAVLPDFLTQLGLEVLPSQTNFILMRFDPEKGVTATEAEQFFSNQKYFATGNGRLWAK